MIRTKEALQSQYEELQQQLTGEMMNDMPIREKMHQLSMEMNEVTPSCGLDGSECENCGS